MGDIFRFPKPDSWRATGQISDAEIEQRMLRFFRQHPILRFNKTVLRKANLDPEIIDPDDCARVARDMAQRNLVRVFQIKCWTWPKTRESRIAVMIGGDWRKNGGAA